MQIRKIYSIVIILLIASVSARAESLQELINRKKIEAIAKVKPIVQKMINDSVEIYKLSQYWKDEYLDVENLEFVYTTALDLNENSYDYHSSTSLYSIIDTSKILGGIVEVINKDHINLFSFQDSNNQYFVDFETLHPKYRSYWNVGIEERVQVWKIQNTYIEHLKAVYSVTDFDFICLPYLRLNAILYDGRFVVFGENEDYFYTFRELDNYLKHLVKIQKDKQLITSILNRAYILKYQKAINDTSWQSTKIIDYSKSIARKSKFIDSVNQKYLKPIQDNPNSKIFDKLENADYFKEVEQILKFSGYTIQEFLANRENLKFFPRYFLQFSDEIIKYNSGKDVLEYLDLKLDKEEGFYIDMVANEKLLIKMDTEGRITHSFTLPKDYIYVDALLPNIIWEIYTPLGYFVNIDNQLYFTEDLKSLKLNKNTDSNIPRLIPYQQYIDQVINGYYIQKVIGE